MRTSVEELFHEVADLPEDARGRYFSERDIDETTRDEVQALLDFDATASLSLERAIGHAAQRALSGLETKNVLCGPYRLTDLLGRGGMGTVHLAERVDGEVAQQVAVKLLRPGADYPALRKRFLAERQILATLSHPNIGRLLDAGHREDGQPYLVMEYVAGKPIDAYAAAMSIRRKIALFVKVCSAVSYLHRNLVIHRDLKPANILVGVDGEPKLLDFGIAKMLDLTTESTVTGMRLLTPDYASPEQACGGPMTTATDIYSLGAVLYEMLTGASPHQFKHDAMESVASTICAGKITLPSKLTPALRGDLETILMKALRKEPQERYATVEQFSDDLRNYLEAGPISARKGEAGYRARKFLRRHWVSAAAAAIVIASLATGLYVANRQRVIAERRFDQLRQLSKRVIDLDAAIRTLPGSVEARQRLVAASLEYLQGLARDAKGDLDLAQETADGYWRMARIQGNNGEFNLGDHAKSEDSLRKADALIDMVLASRPRDRNALIRSALIAHDRMILADTDGRRADTIAHMNRAVGRLDAFLSQGDGGTPVHIEGLMRSSGNAKESQGMGLGFLYADIALANVNMHRYPDGLRYARRALDVLPLIPSAMDLRAQALSLVANALRYQGDLEGALTAVREARQVSEKAVYANETARFFNLYGLIHREALILGEAGAANLDRPDEAIELFGQALKMTDEAARRDPHDSASRGKLGTTARELGDLLRDRPARALSVFDLGMQRLGEAGNSLNTRRDLAVLLAKSSYPLRRLGRAAEAKSRIDSAFVILKSTKDYPSGQVRLGSQTYVAICALADYEAVVDPARALATYEQLLDEVVASKPEPLTDLRDAPKLSRIYEALAGLYGRTGEPSKAAAMRSRRTELWRHWQAQLPGNAFVRRQVSAASGPSM